uniref:Proline rich mitotic checkpoint control factor n=1 Tax=Latimeria chalumnae TaxID=7897 RepID=H3AX19_LATCH
MSLVAYGSSEESDSEEDTHSGLNLPGPTQPGSGLNLPGPTQPGSGLNLPAPTQPGAGLNLPAPKQPGSGLNLPAPTQPGSGLNLPAPTQPGSGLNLPAPTQPGSGLNLPAPTQPGAGLNLPAPKQPGSGLSFLIPSQCGDDGGVLHLPKPKKKTEPVKITVPELQKGDSDSDDDDEPVKKKTATQGSGLGSGLSSLLPQPKNLTVKETNRVLLPQSFAKKATQKPPQDNLAAKPAPSPSAIKAAAKSATKQLTKHIQHEEDSDEEMEPCNFFSLPEKNEVVPPRTEAYYREVKPEGTGVEEEPPELQGDSAAADAPLEFRTAPGSSSGSYGVPGGWATPSGTDYSNEYYDQPQSFSGDQDAYSQSYYSGEYYPEGDPSLVQPQEMDLASVIDEEAVRGVLV